MLATLIISKLTSGHVCSAPSWLVGGGPTAKFAVTRANGARHSSTRFVTDALGAGSSTAFLGLFRRDKHSDSHDLLSVETIRLETRE